MRSIRPPGFRQSNGSGSGLQQPPQQKRGLRVVLACPLPLGASAERRGSCEFPPLQTITRQAATRNIPRLPLQLGSDDPNGADGGGHSSALEPTRAPRKERILQPPNGQEDSQMGNGIGDQRVADTNCAKNVA